jgi:hypothetical protein
MTAFRHGTDAEQRPAEPHFVSISLRSEQWRAEIGSLVRDDA